ncbi:GntR family transcriptional regulator [Mycetocola spongiae]|uniref:GntR family transcriptional regulator n=1 Tax=Mycetocola spongiae TaxID=2859226 RepID=UPI001CF45E3B|nr:GntR family transcriptional regulator [Mycetocola spongiae]UCR89802.1 GntR family transcriptional regulator [Mycetocola spongiae]
MEDDIRPIFLRIAELIENGIVAGTYATGDQVPSTTELAAFHRINPATVGKGLNQLVDRGILHKRRGLGMFVSEGARDALIAERSAEFHGTYIRPLLIEAERLGLDTTDIIALISRKDHP